MNLVNNIQRQIYEALSRKYTVVDVPDENIKLPFIRIAECNYSYEKIKASKKKCYDIEQEIHIWSDYEGKREVNELINIISQLIEEINFEGDLIDNSCIYTNVVDLDGFKQGILKFNIKIDK